MAFKFIHTADIHLDSPLHRLEVYEGAPVEEIRKASRRAFDNLVELAIAEGVAMVVIAGDLFDGDWRDYNTGLYLVKQTRLLGEAGIHVFIAAGNHDAAGRMTRSLPYPENVHLFSSRKPETRIIENPAVAVHGQSFPRAAVVENMALAYPEPVPAYFNLGLLHTSLNGREGHEPYAPCTLPDLVNRGYDYWALGHVHQFELVAAEPPVVFPGCVQGRHIGEPGAKGCVLVRVEQGHPPEISHRAIDLIRWEKVSVDLTAAKHMDDFFERLRQAFVQTAQRHAPKPVIVRVTLTGETELHLKISADTELVKQSVRSSAIADFGEMFWVEKVEVKTRPLAAPAAEPGPLREMGLLVEALKSSDEELLSIGRSLAPLFQKLPPDYRLGASGFRPENVDQLRDLVERAYAHLVSRLRKEAVLS